MVLLKFAICRLTSKKKQFAQLIDFHGYWHILQYWIPRLFSVVAWLNEYLGLVAFKTSDIVDFSTTSFKCIPILTQIATFMGPTWGPPGSCRPQMGLMLAPWTLLSRKAWKSALPYSNGRCHWSSLCLQLSLIRYSRASRQWWWELWRFKSPTIRLFVQHVI